MSKTEIYLNDLAEIRSLMERSSRFISLSGLTGVVTGFYALAGAGVAWYLMNQQGVQLEHGLVRGAAGATLSLQLLLLGLVVLLLALFSGIWLTIRKSRKTGQSIWDKTARLLLVSMLIPLGTGGILCMVLMARGFVSVVAPLTLIFYGLALVNGSKYTLSDIHTLGLLEIGLGLLAACFLGYGLFFWALGFGFLHIAYGFLMYRKYDRG
jgi:predicted lysophospholipase L1 biosynthesis ABC-type transport system permease subunit